MRDSLARLARDITGCELCPRLRRHCAEVARVKRRAYREEEYWGRPVAGFGDPAARLLIVGLAPGAHGANRTGRVFTGDRSGDFLFSVLHATGFASQPESRAQGDGLTLHDAWICAAVRCAPPDNKPTPAEFAACRAYLQRELALLQDVRVVVVLGRLACAAYTEAAGRPRVAFGHAVEYGGAPALLCSYHPSQQNTQTGRLTRPMLVNVFARARVLAEQPASSPRLMYNQE